MVPVDLVDLVELLGLMTTLGDLGCPEELLGTAALVGFREAAGVGVLGAVVGTEGPVGAGAMLGLEDLFDGECMAGPKGLEHLEVMGNMPGLVAEDNGQKARHKKLREVIVGAEAPGGYGQR